MTKSVFLFLCWVSLCLAQPKLECPSLPPHTPANVTDLRPDNIKVVMSFGDSITASFGVDGRAGGLNEFRGVSFSIGMDPNATTVANFVKYFNPSVIGGSLGKHEVELCYGVLCPPFQYRPALDVLNAAQSGAMISDIVTHEVDYMMKEVKANKNINVKEDWKLLTLLIGANDLCASCSFYKDFVSPDEYEKHLMTLITKVRANLPRTFVQIVEMFNISQVYNLSLKSPYCTDVHRLFFVECDCVFKPDGEKSRVEIDTYAQLYNERSRKVASYFQSLNDPEFTVVTQPFGKNTQIATWPIDALSTLDCFHPSVLTHEYMAISLWNNMLTPVAQKQDYLSWDAVPMCPTADTRIN